MSAPRTDSIRPRLEAVIALARLLERVERSPIRIDADQYQALVRQLKGELSDPLPADALNAILSAHPAAAELYENMHYERSGLSRSPLERSIGTEMLAQQALGRIAKAARSAS